MSPTWFRSHAWVVASIGLVLEAAATIPFGLLDVTAPETSAALALLIAAAVAFLVGPRWGALVAAGGWALFFVFVVDHAPRAIVALPLWLALRSWPGSCPTACVVPSESAGATRVSWTLSGAMRPRGSSGSTSTARS